MNIGEIMTSNAKTIGLRDSLLAASKILKEGGFNHLPVVNENGSLVGIVTDRDLKKASASDATTLEVHELLYLLDKLQVGQVMTSNPITISPEDSVQSAAKLLVEHKIGCLPVIMDGTIGGIVTKMDLLNIIARNGA